MVTAAKTVQDVGVRVCKFQVSGEKSVPSLTGLGRILVAQPGTAVPGFHMAPLRGWRRWRAKDENAGLEVMRGVIYTYGLA
jgi:hypothetical protein